MTFKRLGFVFCLLSLLLIFLLVFNNKKQTKSLFVNSTNQKYLSDKGKKAENNTFSPSDKEKLLEKNRTLILGNPHFVQDEKKDFSLLKYIKKQWALKDVALLEAMQVLKDKPIKNPVVVAVVDTGIHTKHPCLKNNLWINKKEIPNNKKDDDGNGFIDDRHGWNFVHNNNDIQDYHGHGTHISGIIAAQGASLQSPNCEMLGLAPHVRIMTLKYFDERAESSDNIKNTIKSIEYAVKNGADIINYSGGGPGANHDEKNIIAKAADKNIIFVAALGNEGSKIGKKIKYYPASYKFPNILSLQSKNKGNEIIKSSNRIQHSYLEDKQVQTAPGENIYSTLPPKIYLQSRLKSKILRNLASSAIKHNNYGHMTGTSQATAMATGVVALVKARYPSWSMRKVINQVNKTGFGQGTEKIKKETNQGKKLSAYEALIMRDKNVDLSDQIDHTNTVIPHDPDKVDSVLKDPKNYDPDKKDEAGNNQFQLLEDISKTFNKKKSK